MCEKLEHFKCKSKIIGHRGAKGIVLENTLESVIYAIENCHVDGIEIDIQLTRDRTLVVYHDNIFDRLVMKDDFYFEKICGKAVKNIQWWHFYNSKLINSAGRVFKLNKLEDFLYHPVLINSDVLINLEIKDNMVCEPLFDLLLELWEDEIYSPDRFLISSYNIKSVKYFSELRFELFDEFSRNFLKKMDNLKDFSKFYFQKIEEEKSKIDEFGKSYQIGWVIDDESLMNNNVKNLKDLLKCYLCTVTLETHSEIKDENLSLLSLLLDTIVIDKSMINKELIDFIHFLDLSIYGYTINNLDNFKNIENLIDGIITDIPHKLIPFLK